MPQVDLFQESQQEVSVSQAPDPSSARQRLMAALLELRTATDFPWTQQQLKSWRVVFRNMAKLLPENESNRLQMEFKEELDRWEKSGSIHIEMESAA